jgi:HAD superfamily hydrolase (TIGR01484 family)
MAGGIRLVVSDVDGTLLDPAGAMTPRTHVALARLRQAGVTFALATSRRWTGAVPVAQQLDFAAPLILYDGALIREFPSGEVLRADTLEASSAHMAAVVLAAHGLQPIAQYCDATGEHLRVAETAKHPEWTEDYLPRFAAQIMFVGLDRLCDWNQAPLRVVAFGPISVLRRAAVALAHLHAGRQLLLTGSYGMAELTIFARTVSKGSALVHLAELFGIALEETLAIGDGLNDVSMLRVAGLGVAMGHAPRRVRAAADIATASNEEDGFALALERYVLSAEVGHLSGSRE